MRIIGYWKTIMYCILIWNCQLMCEALSLPAPSPRPCASLLSQLWSLLIAVSPGNHDDSQTTEAGAQTLWLEKSLLTGIVHAGHPSDLETKRNNIYILRRWKNSPLFRQPCEISFQVASSRNEKRRAYFYSDCIFQAFSLPSHIPKISFREKRPDKRTGSSQVMR